MRTLQYEYNGQVYKTRAEAPNTPIAFFTFQILKNLNGVMKYIRYFRGFWNVQAK